MVSEDLLKRINELARKARNEGLTDREKEEQQELRQKYLENFRQNFKGQLASMTVIDPEGNDVTPEKIKDLKNKKSRRKE